METRIRNAIIENISLRISDGVLTVWLHLKYGDKTEQSFGGYALYLSKVYKHHTNKGDLAGHFIYRCMEIADVENWKDIKGKSIRIEYEEGVGFERKILAIGHIIENDWFNPSEDFGRILK